MKMAPPRAFAVLPTLLTLSNAACGFGAITFAAKVGPTTLGGSELFTAALLIFLGMIFDMFDGSAARWTNQTSEFGAQLDSLCDAITFGVAPAFLMLQVEFAVRSDPQLELPFVYHAKLLWVIACLFVVCVLLRLARFNVETEEDDSHEYFSGLPSPAAAGTVAAFPIALDGLDLLAAERDTQTIAEWMSPAVVLVLPLVTFGVACLMVSRFRYSHVFNQVFRGQRSRQHLIQLVFSLALVALIHSIALPVIFCYYAFATPVKWVWQEIIKRRLYKVPGL